MTVCQGRIRTDALGQQLRAGHRLEAIGRCGREQEFAVFCENEQVPSGQSDRSCAETVFEFRRRASIISQNSGSDLVISSSNSSPSTPTMIAAGLPCLVMSTRSF